MLRPSFERFRMFGEQTTEVDVFGWLRKFRREPWTPEAGWSVAIEEGAITVTDPERATRSVRKRALSGVAISTNDSGPWGLDFWWMLYGKDDALACAFPLGAAGEDAAAEYLKGLPGFDLTAFTDAIRSTRVAAFPVWRREEAEPD